MLNTVSSYLSFRCLGSVVVFSVMLTIMAGCSYFDKNVQTEQSDNSVPASEPVTTLPPKIEEEPVPTIEEPAASTTEVMPGKMTETPTVTIEQPAEAVETMPAENKSAEQLTEAPESRQKQTPISDEATAAAKTPEKIAKITPMVPPAVDDSVKDIKVPVSSGPNHFVITAAVKDSTHPHFGEGHKMGFAVNGKQGKDIVVYRGQQYQIEVATDPKHDVYISSKAIGWGSSAWTDGVEGAFIYKGVITFKPTQNTPDVLYYACRNHPYMGGTIYILNKGQTLSSIKSPPKTTPQSKSKSTFITGMPESSGENISAAVVKQKLMFADMLMNSSSVKKVQESGIKAALEKQNDAKTLIAKARTQLAAGKDSDALAATEQAIVLLKESTKVAPSSQSLAEVERLKEQYKELQVSLQDFEDSHKKSHDHIVKKEGKQAAVAYDKTAVAQLKTEAEAAVKDGDYGQAVAKLTKAQRIVTEAMQKMLDSKTIVYDLKFDTPQEEYEYELKRFVSYEELVPIAIEVKKPAEGAVKLMETYLAKGQKMRDTAKQTAAKGDYPTAIAMLLDATKEVRTALRMVGVMQ